MGETIKRLTIEGFKSIRSLRDFELRSLNVLIGANGAGKSNFVGFFRLLRDLVEQRLQLALSTTEGGADGCLYLGPKETSRLVVQLDFGRNGYEFTLLPTVDNRLVFEQEVTVFHGDFANHRRTYFGPGHSESELKNHVPYGGKSGAQRGVPDDVFHAVSSWVVYHFHDTGLTAGIRRQRPINDDEVLRADGDNLAAFLHRIRSSDPTSYASIRDAVRLAAPFFDDFKLRPVPANPDLIQLEWRQRGSDYPFRASQLSDGTLRFIALATALLQPNPPATVLFDEPELGLHPYALSLLGALVREVTRQVGVEPSNQVILSTQSAALLSEFAPEDVIIVERVDGESVFRRLESAGLEEWLAEYALGELWQKNILGGRPKAENVPLLGQGWANCRP